MNSSRRAKDGRGTGGLHGRAYLRRLGFGMALSVWMMILGGGCQLAVSPYADELADQPAVTTLSADGIRAANAAPRESARRFDPIEMPPGYDVGVDHLPLFFEDPFEGMGSEDDRFAWTAEEYLCLVYGPSRFLVNGLFAPVSAVVTPPWVTMNSDGIIGERDRDPVRAARK